MVRISDYKEEEVQICFSVLMEIMTILGDFRENIVIVGGNVPPLIIPENKDDYSGTLDIDIALDFKNIDDNTYKTIEKTLLDNDYYQKEKGQPFQFYRDIDEVTVKVDLLAGEYGGTKRNKRHQRIQDVRARKARGCDLVFDRAFRVEIRGVLPSGSENKVVVKVANIVPFLVTKGMALWNRKKEKDAYDIYFCLKFYPGGVKVLVNKVKPFLKNKLVREGLSKIKGKFEKLNSIGPNFVVDFLEISNSEEKDRIRRVAFELVAELMDQLDIVPYDELSENNESEVSSVEKQEHT